ncbi:MAG: phosphoenolpyruvate hydrolase family protein [Candidatus Bathyarchaeia archaeon]
MAGNIPRSDIIKRLKKTAAEGLPLVVVSATTGISARCSEAAGVSLIAVYNAGVFRAAGLGSLYAFLPYGDANEVTLEKLGPQVLKMTKNTPVIVGIGAHDPFRDMDGLIDKAVNMGFSGIENVPLVGFYGDEFKAMLESGGMGFSREVELIRKANKRDIFTAAFVFTKDEAKRMAEAGADVIIAHCGLTTGGAIGAKTSIALDAAASFTNGIVEAAKAVKPDAFFMVHGGPVEAPAQVQYVLERTDVHGFVAGSAFERTPIENALMNAIKEFQAVKPKK